MTASDLISNSALSDGSLGAWQAEREYMAVTSLRALTWKLENGRFIWFIPPGCIQAIFIQWVDTRVNVPGGRWHLALPLGYSVAAWDIPMAVLHSWYEGRGVTGIKAETAVRVISVCKGLTALPR